MGFHHRSPSAPLLNAPFRRQKVLAIRPCAYPAASIVWSWNGSRHLGGKKLMIRRFFSHLYTEGYNPWKLRGHWKIPMFNKKYIFKRWVFHCHVSFPGGGVLSVSPIDTYRILLGKSLVVPYTLSPFTFGVLFKCNSLKIQPLAGDLSFA